MERRTLGRTGIEVSRMCLGSLTMGPLQADLSVEKGADIIVRAFELGVNFVDTAELYRTYAHIRRALSRIGRRDALVIASRSYDYEAEGMAASLERALCELDTSYLDLFMLHEQESRKTLAGHRHAVEFLVEARRSGTVRAVGVSTHFVEVVRACASMEEVDCVHPMLNVRGLGIRDGSVADMVAAIREAHAARKGVYTMKPLGGGHLVRSPGVVEALRYVLAFDEVASVAVGIRSIEELEADVAVFEGRPLEARRLERLTRSKGLHVESWCEGCGRCVATCPQGALAVRSGRLEVDQDACVLCGYCGAVCPNFAVKVI